MDKKIKIIFIIIAIAIIIAVIIFVKFLDSNKNDSDNKTTNIEISSVDDLKDLIEKIYKEDKPFPTLETRTIDTSDSTEVQAVTGSDDGDDFEYLVASEPMISSQAYSFVLGKVKSGVNADEVAKEIYENINPRKWICVSAEKVCTTSSGDIVALIMTSKEKTEKVYNKFKELVGSVRKEYSKNVQDEFDEDLDEESSGDLDEENLSNDIENQDDENLSNDIENQDEENLSNDIENQNDENSSNNTKVQDGFEKPIISLDDLKNTTAQ